MLALMSQPINRSTHSQIGLAPRHSLTYATAMLMVLILPACSGGGDTNELEASEQAAELEAGANNAIDESQAELMRESANSLRQVSRGNEVEADQQVTITTQ